MQNYTIHNLKVLQNRWIFPSIFVIMLMVIFMIKRLTKEDIEEIIPLRIDLQRYDLRYDNKTDFDISLDKLIDLTGKYLKEHIEDDLYLFGYFKDEELISISGFIKEYAFPTNSNPSSITAYITTVYTKEEYRGKGYQKKLLTHLLDYAKNMGILRYKLDSLNEVAIKMHKELGFVKSENDYKMKI